MRNKTLKCELKQTHAIISYNIFHSQKTLQHT